MLATSQAALHQAALFGYLTDDLALLTHTAANLNEAEIQRLRDAGVRTIDGEVGQVIGEEQLTAVELADGRAIERSGTCR